MRFITLSTRPMDDDADLSIRRQPRMLRESTAYFQVPLENICPLGSDHEWTGRVRQKYVLEYLTRVPDDEPVLLTDAWDSFFNGTPAEMEEAFRSCGKGVVISTEANLWPPEGAKYLNHPPAPSRWRYACGGGWCGYARNLREMFTAPDYWPKWSICDQGSFDDWFCRHQDTVALDWHCRLFQCTYDDGTTKPPMWTVFAVRNGRAVNLETKTHPLVWHGGGGFADRTQKLWDQVKEQRK